MTAVHSKIGGGPRRWIHCYIAPGYRTTGFSLSDSSMVGSALALAIQLQVGDLVTVGTGAAARCARITYVDANPVGVAWYWLELEQQAVPRNVLRVRLEHLRPGCDGAEGGGSTKS